MLKLLKIDKTKKTLLEVEEGNIKPELFAKEKEMEDFFAKNDNLNKIFPQWHFLTKQWPIGSNRIQDTIIFNPTTLSFAIIEYKLDDHNRIEQVIKYLEKMNQEQKEELIEEAKFNYYSPRNKRWNTNIYNYKLWKKNEVKLILMSSLPEKFKKLSEWENVSIVRVGFYKIERKQFLYVDTNDLELLPKKQIKSLSSISIKGKHEEIINLETAKEKIISQEVSLLLLPEYKPRLSESSQRWILEIEETLKDKFNLVLKITAKARYLTFYTNNNDFVLRIPLCRKKIIRIFLDLSPTQPEEKKIINDFSLKPNYWWRKNDHEYTISDEESFNRFFDLLNALLKRIKK